MAVFLTDLERALYCLDATPAVILPRPFALTDYDQEAFHFHRHLIPVPRDEPFPLQLPNPSAPVPSRSALGVMAAQIGRCIQEEAMSGAA